MDGKVSASCSLVLFMLGVVLLPSTFATAAETNDQLQQEVKELTRISHSYSFLVHFDHRSCFLCRL
jgi:hypothetical protein